MKRDRQPFLAKVTKTYAHTEDVYYVNGLEVYRQENCDIWLEDEETHSISPEDFEDETGYDLSE